MKLFSTLLIVATMLMGCYGCANAGTSTATSGTDTPAVSQSTHSFAKSTIALPDYMLPGPLDPVWGPDEVMLVAVANLGNFASIKELKQSPFYPILLSCYPDLDKVKDFIDTGSGDLWYIRPLAENCSLAINEYNMDMFNGVQPEGSGKVYYRTEEAQSLLLRMSAHDPGTVQINVVDNEGHTLSWIPTMQPADNTLRETDGTMDITYNPIVWMAELGADYKCELADKQATLRFYGDRVVSINGRLGRYMSFHLKNNDNGVGLYYIDSEGREGTAIITKFEQTDDAFNFQHLKGYGLGIDDFATFLKH